MNRLIPKEYNPVPGWILFVLAVWIICAAVVLLLDHGLRWLGA